VAAEQHGAQLADWEAKVAAMEESLELMRTEFESMEDYWQKKLEEERVFYGEQLRRNEEQFKELEAKMRDYEALLDSGGGVDISRKDEEEEVR
jgi:DNA repair exonuclease SbcCD ATPase subunit